MLHDPWLDRWLPLLRERATGPPVLEWACGHPQIEPHYHLVRGSPKRFFDEAAVDRLFASGWRTLSRGHCVTRKDVVPKALWEVVLETGA